MPPRRVPRSTNVDPLLIERFGAEVPKRKRCFSLPLAQIEPQIRLAHRRSGAHEIAERIILDHEIVVMLAGKGTFVHRDGAMDLEPGDLVFVRPFVPHSFRFAGRTVEHLAIHFDLAPHVPSFTDDPSRRRPYEVLLGNTLHLPVYTRARRAPWIRQAVLRVLEEWMRGTVLDVLAAQAELLLVLVRLARLSKGDTEAAEPGRHNSSAEAAVRRALAKAWPFASVRDLAREAGISVSHLRRVVHGWVGRSPAAYLREEQVNRARKLLADPQRSIKSIAFDVGFTSPHHFSKVFRRVDGLSPSEYRAAMLGRATRAGRSDSAVKAENSAHRV